MKEVQQNLVEYLIALGDDALILGQRLSEWCYMAPFLEEDLAISNVGLDLIGRAKMLYEYAAEAEGSVRTADAIAFLRDSRDYRNLLITELPIGDFANSMARQLIVDIFNLEYLKKLQDSADPQLAGIAGKAVKESHYHLRRSSEWVIRLGDGTDESHRRIQTAFDGLWGYTHELFEMSGFETSLLAEGISVDRAALRDTWDQQIDTILSRATLCRPDESWSIVGGRDGIHTEYLGPTLAEMQFLQRAYPGLEW